MIRAKTKEFRDPVHGYVSVPAKLCAAFIDTPIFQRLRHIEQTSMRPLYPSAHHDRFVHSLGVYHLAVIAFRHLAENTEVSILNEINLREFEPAFLVAALMHDCAHSPFSHLLEAHYGRGGRDKEFLYEHVNDSFREDYNTRCRFVGGAQPHEVFSAAVFLRHFRDAFESLYEECDPLLVARMITGCTHWEPQNRRDQVENCLIRLLNGRAIDVDKLDYVLRDTWSSGVNNVSVDVQRLLSALEIVDGPRGLLEVAFRKSALSVLQSMIDGRNFLFRWIYTHHTVCYYSFVLQKAVDQLDKILSPGETSGAFLDAMFSAEVFEGAVPVNASASVYLPCDYDIYSLLKLRREEITEVDEILGRKPSVVPLWKTQAEFETIFAHNQRPAERTYIRSNLRGILSDVLEEDSRVLTIPVRPKIQEIEEDDVYVILLDEVVSFLELARKWQGIQAEKENASFFYGYIPREQEDRVSACVVRLRSYRVSG